MRTLKEIIQQLGSLEDESLIPIPHQDINAMMQRASELTVFLASTASLVAEAGKHYNHVKAEMYNTDKLYKMLTPALAKDYINALCEDEGYAYEKAERLNRCFTHQIDMLRSIMSAEKSSMQLGNYQS